MAHYAFLENNVVTEVIVGNDGGGVDWETYYGGKRGQICKKTSYNTRGGIHQLGEAPLRKNYAGIGFTYDSSRDAFIPLKLFASWTLDENTCQWVSPVSYPSDGKNYGWDEILTTWVEFIKE